MKHEAKIMFYRPIIIKRGGRASKYFMKNRKKDILLNQFLSSDRKVYDCLKVKVLFVYFALYIYV
jgi:Zn-dependent peptidase ImmA (M78 family)